MCKLIPMLSILMALSSCLQFREPDFYHSAHNKDLEPAIARLSFDMTAEEAYQVIGLQPEFSLPVILTEKIKKFAESKRNEQKKYNTFYGTEDNAPYDEKLHWRKLILEKVYVWDRKFFGAPVEPLHKWKFKPDVLRSVPLDGSYRVEFIRTRRSYPDCFYGHSDSGVQEYLLMLFDADDKLSGWFFPAIYGWLNGAVGRMKKSGVF